MSPPSFELCSHVNPLAVARDDRHACVATVRLDVNAPKDAPARRLNLALVLDQSWSMNGEKIETAKAVAAAVLGRMHDDDVVTVVAFSNQPTLLVPATRLGDGRPQAEGALKGIEAIAETHMGPALQAALEQLRPHVRPERVNAVFLLTDGAASDPDAALRLGPQLPAQGVALYAAGIGGEYNHEFLDRLCGKERVEHVDQPDKMQEMFDRFLEREGRAASANGRLFVEPAPGVELQLLTTAQDRGRPRPLDQKQSLAAPDLFPGQKWQLRLDLVFHPKQAGTRPLATFRLRYDLPAAGVVGAEARLEAAVEVTDDPARQDVPNPEVQKLLGHIRAAALADQAEQDVERKDIRGATKKLRRVTAELEKLGEHGLADVYRQRTEALEQANPDAIDREAKRLRGTTKELTRL